MEPNKLENEIRNQLNQRSIQPSENSWDRLDAMLSVEEQKPKRNYKWISIAAIFVGFTLIGIFVINKDKSVENVIPSNPIVLENEAKLIENETELIKNETTSKIENNFSEETANKTVVHQSIIKIEQPSTEIDPKKDIILDNHSIKGEIVEKQQKESTAKYINAESLLAEIETGEKIEIPNISKKSTLKIDANSLLSSAEKEVDESFRDKAIQTLNKSYKSVKSMLANRNNQ